MNKNNGLYLKSHPLQYFSLLIYPSIGSCLVVLLWKYIHPFVVIPYQDTYIIESMVFLPGIPYAYLAGLTIQKAYDEKSKIEKAWKCNTPDLFKEYIDERISPITQFILSILSIIVLYIFFLCPLEAYTGKRVIAISSFIIILLWIIARELDDPYGGISKLNKEAIKNRWPEIFQ